MEKSKDQVSSHFKASEQTLLKIVNIGLQYLKEDIKSLHKAVLKMCKRVVQAVSEENLAEFSKIVIPQILTFGGKTSSIVYVKQVLTKFVKRIGADKVKEICPKEDIPLIDYVVKQIKKVKKDKKKLRKLMKEDEEEKQQTRLIEGDKEVYSSDESQESDEEKQMDSRIRASDIPVVRKLKIKNGIAVLETKKAPQIDKIMDIEEDEYNPHFAVNSVLEIKKRQKQREKLNSKKQNQKETEESSDEEILYDQREDKIIVEDKSNKLAGKK